MNPKERLEKLVKLAGLEYKQIEPLYYRFQDKSVEQIAEILKEKYPDKVRNFEVNKVWYRFTTIYKALGIEVEKKEGGEKENEEKKQPTLISEYSPIFMEFFQSEDDLKRWGQIRAEMLRQIDELQAELNKEERNKSAPTRFPLWLLIAIPLLFLSIFAVFQFVLIPFFITPASTFAPTLSPKPTLTQTPPFSRIPSSTPTPPTILTQTVTINEVTEDFENGDAQGFGFEGNGTWEVKNESGNDDSGNLVLEVITDDTSTLHIDFPPAMFSGNLIEFQVKFTVIPGDLTENNEDWGSFDIHFREQTDGKESYVLAVRPPEPLENIELSYVPPGEDSEWEPIQGTDYPIMFKENEWHTIRLELVEDQISVYLDGNPIFEVTDTRLDTGALLFLVRPNTTIQLDNIRVQEEP